MTAQCRGTQKYSTSHRWYTGFQAADRPPEGKVQHAAALLTHPSLATDLAAVGSRDEFLRQPSTRIRDTQTQVSDGIKHCYARIRQELQRRYGIMDLIN
jgi:hypothetical protein